MVDIQSATAEIMRGKKIEERRRKKKKSHDENIMLASATQGGHKNRQKFAICAPSRNFCLLYLRN